MTLRGDAPPGIRRRIVGTAGGASSDLTAHQRDRYGPDDGGDDGPARSGQRQLSMALLARSWRSAMLLARIGIYGVMSFDVTRRSQTGPQLTLARTALACAKQTR